MDLPLGTPLNLEEAEQFIKSRKNREQFNGIAEMRGTAEGRGYKVELLMAEGEVVAMEIIGISETPLRGDRALEEMDLLGGSEGDLKLVSLRGADMNRIKQENKEALLQKTITLEDFKIRIKPAPKQPQPREGTGVLKTLASLFSSGAPSDKTEFKGMFILDRQRTLQVAKPETEINVVKKEPAAGEQHGEEPKTEVPQDKRESQPGVQDAGGSEAKQDLISRVKSRRFGRITENLISKRKEKKPKTETMLEKEMVETTIDKLFNLLDKRDKLKINEGLAKELGVSKERVEEWAVILEEHNLVSIKYPTIGEPEITKKKR